MDRQQAFKEMLSNIIREKCSLYGKVLITKIGATGKIDIAPSGEIVSIIGDPKAATEGVLNIFKDISGNVGLASAIKTLKAYSDDYPDIKTDIDEVIAKF